MGAAPVPIRLTPADAERYARLRRHMLEEVPWAFGASAEDDEWLDLPRLAALFAQEESATFAVEAESAGSAAPAGTGGPRGRPGLVAVASVTRERRPRFAHRARIWGVYVEPSRRGRGLARAVMTAALELARGWPGVDFLDLGVSENSAEAERLYRSLGFEAWGREPEATQHRGRRYDEIHMTRRL